MRARQLELGVADRLPKINTVDLGTQGAAQGLMGSEVGSVRIASDISRVLRVLQRFARDLHATELQLG